MSPSTGSKFGYNRSYRFREEVAPSIQKILRQLNESKSVERLWLYSMKAWYETIKYGHFDLG
jgi:hypothetical protein